MQLNETLPLSKQQLDIYCDNIFSNDKAKRKQGRASIIKYIEYFKEPHKFEEFSSSYYSISYVINRFVNKGKFCFKINDKEAGMPIIKNQKPQKGIHTSLPLNSEKPTYLVNMPHLAAGSHSLEKQLDLLFNEGFGQNEKESKQEAKERLQVFVGINYCHSINHTVNKKKKKYIQDLLAKGNRPNVDYHIFSWSPNWICSTTKATELLHPHGVKRVFRLLQEIDDNKATLIYDQLIKEKVVPYQRIREEIKNSTVLKDYFKEFRRENKKRPAYLVSFDDDAVRLRTKNLGLFSHYDKLIKDNPKLEIATTGYYMIHPKDKSVEIASRVNLTARIGFSSYRPNGAYLPEPNIIIKIPECSDIPFKISFLRDREEYGKNLESIGLLENLDLMEGNVVKKVIFGAEGAIQTSVSPNVKIKKDLHFNINRENFFHSKHLKTLRSFSQSAINPIFGFSANILRTFPEGANKAEYRKVVAKIFKSFDPIEYAKAEFEHWPKTYNLLSKAIFNYTKDGDGDLDSFSLFVASKAVKDLNLKTKNKLAIAKFTTEKIIRLIDAKNLLIESKKFNKEDIALLVETSFHVNRAVFKELQQIYSELQ